eukprot:CAMPEP_0167789464 /NCGR_PEP_ID=MMETSP0111_2-20121227/10703_1 /TAXON_ID=91324 /ORGANISM="Lotharella globosa, Strain CCCM811" /LENGTH=200 /DNA_ID=CAMNT_0007681641 /DNA_START=483 /DNA_END=1085 /DNA_ORIENTATION=+
MNPVIFVLLVIPVFPKFICLRTPLLDNCGASMCSNEPRADERSDGCVFKEIRILVIALNDEEWGVDIDPLLQGLGSVRGGVRPDAAVLSEKVHTDNVGLGLDLDATPRFVREVFRAIDQGLSFSEIEHAQVPTWVLSLPRIDADALHRRGVLSSAVPKHPNNLWDRVPETLRLEGLVLRAQHLCLGYTGKEHKQAYAHGF